MLPGRSHLCAIVAGCLLPSWAFADNGTFTIEQIMSAPFVGHLSAAPAGGRIAWVFNERGARNVWIAEPPEYRGLRLTSYGEDDGQEIGGLDWSADGKILAYARGGEDGGGTDPNPLSKPNIPEQTIWLVAMDKGSPRSVGPGRSPKISP